MSMKTRGEIMNGGIYLGTILVQIAFKTLAEVTKVVSETEGRRDAKNTNVKSWWDEKKPAKDTDKGQLVR